MPALPSSPIDGERHMIEDQLAGGAYARTVTTSQTILLANGSGTSLVTNPGEFVTFRYSATMGDWVIG
jgi:hypothetical protein